MPSTKRSSPYIDDILEKKIKIFNTEIINLVLCNRHCISGVHFTYTKAIATVAPISNRCSYETSYQT